MQRQNVPMGRGVTMRAGGVRRAIDYVFGVPVVFLLGLFRRKRRWPEKLNAVGFIAPSAIGDLILDSGVLLNVRKHHPDAVIHLFVSKSNREVVPLLPVNCVVHVCEFFNVLDVIRTIRRESLDVVADFAPWPRLTAICAALSGAVTVGFRSLKQFRHFAFDVVIEHSRDCHEMENLKGMASVFGKCSQYMVALTVEEGADVVNRDAAELCIFCHCVPGGSRAAYKMWPQENWVAFSREMISKGYKLVYTGSERDSCYVNEILSALECGGSFVSGSVRSDCGKLSLVQLASALRAARLCVSVDTGIMHLAWVLGVPTVALMGAAPARRWGARSDASVNVESSHPCAGFIHLGFERRRGANEVMSAIKVKSVCDAAFRLLREQG